MVFWRAQKSPIYRCEWWWVKIPWLMMNIL